jgi:hypothetical protein
MSTYTWSFPQFIVDPEFNGLTNVVTAINWVCTGANGNVTSSASGTVNLGTPNPAQFVPYADITQEMAYQWVSQCISMPGVENKLGIQLTLLSQPTKKPQNPPF